ncbi:MAG: DUF2293 domain-containing protein [Terriglobia bacterium]|jgi:hypothetical protein
MNSKPQRPLEERVVEAANAALSDQGYVSPIDVFIRMGWLASVHVERWRIGRLPNLETMIQVNPDKISKTMALFQEWARNRNLKPSETAYLARTTGPRCDLQFSRSGDPSIERFYRTHYVSPELSERKQEKLREKLSQPPELVVFDIIRESKCSECEAELAKGSFLVMEAERPLCLECADLDHLLYLPSGDATLTRRARKYSKLSAVVVRFSRARRRYERQGALVEEDALRKAEEECFSDAEVRARRRERDAVRRIDEDEKVTTHMAAKILDLFPRCPPEEARTIAEHAAQRGSGRIGRSAAGRRLEEESVRLAVIASIRHRHTHYDEILMESADRAWARAQVRDEIDEILRAWGPPEPEEI